MEYEIYTALLLLQPIQRKELIRKTESVTGKIVSKRRFTILFRTAIWKCVWDGNDFWEMVMCVASSLFVCLLLLCLQWQKHEAQYLENTKIKFI
jgi:hypothetical protein